MPVVLSGMGLWVLAGAAVLIRYHYLTHAGHGWWLWTCVSGFAAGALLVGYELWRRAQHRAGKVEARPGEPAPSTRR